MDVLRRNQRLTSQRLIGPNPLVNAPLTVEDWRLIHMAYCAFMATVRTVAQQAYERSREQPKREGR